MALARHQFNVQDREGNILPGAVVEVRAELPGAPLANLFSDRGGTISIDNPLEADADGYVGFHVTGGAYKITADLGGDEQVFRYVPIGTQAESDLGVQFTNKGNYDGGYTYAKWDLVTDQGSSWIFINDTGSAGHAPPTLPTTVDSYWQLLSQAGSPGGPVTIEYTFSTTTTDADPGNGKLRLGSATQNASTVIRADLLDNLGSTWTGVLDLMDASSSAVKGTIRIGHKFDETKFLVFALSSRAAPSGYRNFTVTCIGYSAASPFANNDPLLFEFIRTGDKGDQGIQGEDAGLKFTFNSATSGDPGAGKFLFNHATFLSATQLNISETDGDANAVAAFLAAIDDASSSNKALAIFKKSGSAAYFLAWITSTLTDAGAYDTFAITPIAAVGAIANADVCRLSIARTGDKGDPGNTGPAGASSLTICRVVAATNVDIATALENGDALDGVTLATNDRVLLAGQTAPEENGIYIVQASGAAVRDSSFATFDTMPGVYVSVMEGTTNQDTLWRCTSNRGGTIGSTALAFSKFSSGGAGVSLTSTKLRFLAP